MEVGGVVRFSAVPEGASYTRPEGWPELMVLRGVALAWWRRWRGVEGAVAQEEIGRASCRERVYVLV